jgi:hypothetical protein
MEVQQVEMECQCRCCYHTMRLGLRLGLAPRLPLRLGLGRSEARAIRHLCRPAVLLDGPLNLLACLHSHLWLRSQHLCNEATLSVRACITSALSMASCHGCTRCYFSTIISLLLCCYCRCPLPFKHGGISYLHAFSRTPPTITLQRPKNPKLLPSFADCRSRAQLSIAGCGWGWEGRNADADASRWLHAGRRPFRARCRVCLYHCHYHCHFGAAPSKCLRPPSISLTLCLASRNSSPTAARIALSKQ